MSFGLPVAADQTHRVFQGAVGADAFGGELDERPVMRTRGVGEQGLKRDADGTLMERILMCEAGKRVVVSL